MSTKPANPNERTHDDTIERTAIVMYGVLKEMNAALASPDGGDDIPLGMLMGLSMFLDERIGPFRAERLMAAAPSIILRTDAHVVPEQLSQFLPVIHALGGRLATARVAAMSDESL